MAVTQKVALYNNKFTVPPVINAVQNDTDRQVEAYFGDFTLQVGMTGKLSFIRSDCTHYEVSATLNTGANTATAELDQALTQAGVTQAQLKITDSGNVGSTFTFMIKVQPDVAGISVEQDGWSAQEFDQRLTDAENAIDAVEEDVADLQDKEYDYAPVITDTASGSIASFPDGADGYPLKECVINIEAVQEGTGDPSPDNVRPVSGWSEAKVTRTGKNLFNKATVTSGKGSNASGSLVNLDWCNVSDYIAVKPNTVYYMSHGVGNSALCGGAFYTTDKTFITYISSAGQRDANFSFTTPNSAGFIRLNVATDNLNTAQLELGSIATAYEPYQGQTYTISLGDTRYGAVLDVTRGKLRVTHGITDLTEGMTGGAAQSNYVWYKSLTNAKTVANSEIADIKAEAYKAIRYNAIASNFYHIALRDNGAIYVSVPDSSVLPQGNAVFALATPIEVDLTPTEITTLLGVNNLWSDTGDVEVEYCCSTKLFIEKKLAELMA